MKNKAALARKLRYGGVTAVLTAAIIAIVIIINVMFTALAHKKLWYGGKGIPLWGAGLWKRAAGHSGAAGTGKAPFRHYAYGYGGCGYDVCGRYQPQMASGRSRCGSGFRSCVYQLYGVRRRPCYGLAASGSGSGRYRISDFAVAVCHWLRRLVWTGIGKKIRLRR